jgi:hypothetical protein
MWFFKFENEKWSLNTGKPDTMEQTVDHINEMTA